VTDVRDNIATVARQAVQAMVGRDVGVSVDADRRQLAGQDEARRPRAARSVGVIVSVELSGPHDKLHNSTRRETARGEAAAWGIDEVVSAARQAAERILGDNPGWRRE
jgi:hypothetical protein